jgi:hypothetical protein
LAKVSKSLRQGLLSLKKISVTRRKLLKTLLALGAGGVFLSGPLAGKISFAAAEGPFTLESFVALSSLVTLQDKLDNDTAQRMYDVFMKEPWGPEHMAGLFAKLRSALAGKKEELTDGEKWFSGHLLTTWYLGVYYHESSPPLRLAYDTALMFRAGDGVIPVPLVESVAFGDWAKKPA